MATYDERTEENLKGLLLPVQRKARALIAALQSDPRFAGVTVRVISGYRSYAEQDALFAQRPKVTNARGGYSNHNFRVAFDLGLFRGKDYLEEDSLYAVAGHIGKALGLEWGGDWDSFPDPPHFQYPTGLTMAQMRERVAKGIPILPEDAGAQGWSVYDDQGTLLESGLQTGEHGTGFVREVAEAAGGSLRIVGREIHIVRARA